MDQQSLAILQAATKLAAAAYYLAAAVVALTAALLAGLLIDLRDARRDSK